MTGSAAWEFSLFDWSLHGADGVALDPRHISKLISAQSAKDAREAFFVVSWAVGENGKIYPCALSVLRAVLAALPMCDTHAKACCLELIVNIAASSPGGDSEKLWRDCQNEIRNAYWIFASGIRFDDTALVASYVDILGCIGLVFSDFRVISHRYLEMALTRDIPEGDIQMIRNTIRELEQELSE